LVFDEIIILEDEASRCVPLGAGLECPSSTSMKKGSPMGRNISMKQGGPRDGADLADLATRRKTIRSYMNLPLLHTRWQVATLLLFSGGDKSRSRILMTKNLASGN
jgi:hypothetical protein